MATALKVLDPSEPVSFIRPSKKINDIHDVVRFHHSHAYSDIVTFLFQLNVSVFPRRIDAGDDSRASVRTWESGSAEEDLSVEVKRLRALLRKLEEIIDEAPPDAGPRRFGNVSFKKWYAIVEERMSALLDEHLPDAVLAYGASDADQEQAPDGAAKEDVVTARDELAAYFMGSFGSAQRLDYGTGHELSFLAFLAVIWKLGGFHGRSARRRDGENTSEKNDPPKDDGTATDEAHQKEKHQREAGEQERDIVLGIMDSYFALVRRLIKTYTLEPAGSHGVWGLDDHFFLPYIFGSAQYCPAISSVQDALPSEGSLEAAPDAGDIAQAAVVERERDRNMYFGAVGFINDVKKGPFWEHSPVLFDISGVTAGWAKINKGMLKMYNAEVLSKFPVVQHFPFGGILSWRESAPGDSAVGTDASVVPGTNAAAAADGGGPAPGNSNETSTMGIPSVLQQSSLHESSLPSLNPISPLNPTIVPSAFPGSLPAVSGHTAGNPLATGVPRGPTSLYGGQIPGTATSAVSGAAAMPAPTAFPGARPVQGTSTTMPGATAFPRTTMPGSAMAMPGPAVPSTALPSATTFPRNRVPSGATATATSTSMLPPPGGVGIGWPGATGAVGSERHEQAAKTLVESIRPPPPAPPTFTGSTAAAGSSPGGGRRVSSSSSAEAARSHAVAGDSGHAAPPSSPGSVPAPPPPTPAGDADSAPLSTSTSTSTGTPTLGQASPGAFKDAPKATTDNARAQETSGEKS